MFHLPHTRLSSSSKHVSHYPQFVFDRLNSHVQNLEGWRREDNAGSPAVIFEVEVLGKAVGASTRLRNPRRIIRSATDQLSASFPPIVELGYVCWVFDNDEQTSISTNHEGNCACCAPSRILCRYLQIRAMSLPAHLSIPETECPIFQCQSLNDIEHRSRSAEAYCTESLLGSQEHHRRTISELC
jgi:hypothetical protein